jgi:hypothetical protein
MKTYLNTFYGEECKTVLDGAKENLRFKEKMPLALTVQEEVEYYTGHWYKAMKRMMKEDIKI